MGPFGHDKFLGDMVARYMPNSDPWGPPGTAFMTIFVFYVNSQMSNIEKNEAYEVYKSREVSHLFSHQISRRMPSESCLGIYFVTRVECMAGKAWKALVKK